MSIQEEQTVLSRLLIPLFSRLTREKQPYCVCGNYKNLPFHTENDVDLWAKNPKAVIAIVKEVSTECGLTLYLENKNATGSNLFFWIQTEMGPVTVHLDVLSECRWHSFLPLVKSREIEQQRKKYNGFMVATETIDAAMHFMHPLTHFGEIREKYFHDFIRESSNPGFRRIIEAGLGATFYQEISPLLQEHNWQAIEKAFVRRKNDVLMHAIRQMRVAQWQSFFRFIVSNLRRLLRPNGLFVAFVGPDGCGKTTVQKNLQPFFEKGFTKGKIKKFYWRPFLLPLIKSLLPGAKNKKLVASDPAERLKLRHASLVQQITHIVKLFYYCFDFLVGRLKYQAVWSKGGVVCFDRYWDDLLIFPERFGLCVSSVLVRALGIFVPKPDIVFYLHAEAEVLTARKLELPIEEMTQQIAGYKELAQNRQHYVQIQADLSEEDVVSNVVTTCLTKMSDRYDKT